MEAKQPVPREAVLVVNTHSRRGQDLFRRAQELLAEAGIRITQSFPVEDPKELIPTMKRAVATGTPMVIVGGGDGSLSCTVDDVVGHDCVFALLPLGTANSFARTLGIPLDLEGAVQVIATGSRRRVDLGMIDGDYFANAAALGLSPMIGKSIPHKLKRYLGRIGYLIWAVWCLIRFRAFRLTIEDEQGTHRLKAMEVRIANGRFHGGVEVMPEADVDSGDIVVQAVTGHLKRRLVWNWIASILHLPERKDTMEIFRGKAIRIETVPPLPISIDGEVLARTPVTVKVAERAIEVVAPATTDENPTRPS